MPILGNGWILGSFVEKKGKYKYFRMGTGLKATVQACASRLIFPQLL
jgi:hypothetical protein